MSLDLVSERPKTGERAILVSVFFLQEGFMRIDKALIAEFRDLALAAGVTILAEMTMQRSKPTAKYLFGAGKLQEIKTELQQQQADVVLVNHALSPAQQRNLERELQSRVLDRTSLILDIFAQRARSFEGKLQVELAQLTHLATRLVRGWTHLERQKGGIGLRGPGETQLETDRRLLNRRIKVIHKRLAKVAQQRSQNRAARQRAAIPMLSLVGYTNAGKTTLFNRLTTAQCYAADKLFATLDPTLRRVALAKHLHVILADTVGFIQHLPHELVKAFHATLEETINADLLLHVIDADSELREQHKADVRAVLTEIEADSIPQLQVYNKIDLLDHIEPHIDYDQQGKPIRVWLSATTGDGLELLQQALTQLINKKMLYKQVTLTPQQGSLRAKLYANGFVEQEVIDAEGNMNMTINLPADEYDKLFLCTE